MTPRASTLPQLYGLPKVHKDGIPLRPIVSAIGSPTYSLSKELARILSPLADTTLDDADRLISFDVTNLFTKVPLDEAMEAIMFKVLAVYSEIRAAMCYCFPT